MKTFMKNIVIAATAATPFFVAVGCEDTVSQKTTTERRSDGTTVEETQKKTVDRDGDVTETREKKVDRDNRVNP